MSEKRYNVVFEYTDKAGGYEGNRYMVSYSSKEYFEEHNSPENLAKLNLKVLEQGLSEDKATELAKNVPLWRQVARVYQEIINKLGKLDYARLGTELLKLQYEDIPYFDILEAQQEFFEKEDKGLVKLIRSKRE